MLLTQAILRKQTPLFALGKFDFEFDFSIWNHPSLRIIDIDS